MLPTMVERQMAGSMRILTSYSPSSLVIPSMVSACHGSKHR